MMTTSFGRAWPSSGHKLFFKLTILKTKHIHEKGLLEVVCIHGVQRDLVVNRILFYMYWLKLYKYKNWVRI